MRLLRVLCRPFGEKCVVGHRARLLIRRSARGTCSGNIHMEDEVKDQEDEVEDGRDK